MFWLVSLGVYLSCVMFGSLAIADEATPQDKFVEIPTPEYVRLMMARDPAVQRALKLSAEQRKNLNAAVIEVDQPFWKLRDLPPAKSARQLQTLDQQLRLRMAHALTARQQSRFEQLVMQARGARALLAADVQRDLDLGSDQITSISEVIGSARGGTLPTQRVLDVLRPEQRSTFSELFGERFDLRQISQIGCVAPELRGVEAWINSPPLTLQSQRGKVVVVHFWAFGCINCIRNLPHYQAWYEKFSTEDLTIVGIHTPETSAERDLELLRASTLERGIQYPVAFDLKGENWQAWTNNLWPSVYLIDRQGQVRAWWYGELNWQGATGESQMRQKLAALIAEH